jgi:enoyl-CoA hydratase/carnithine racemase
MSDASDVLVIDRPEPAICLLTLNRPHVLNAVDGVLARAIDHALDEVDADPTIRVAIVTGAGRAFCAGADLKALAREGNLVHLGDRGFAGIANRRRNKPLIAAVEGPAFGGGFEICLAADLVTASTTASFALPEVLRSVIAVGGGLLRLGRTLPTALVMEIVLTGLPVSAQRAWQLGLINRLTEPDGALTAAYEIARAIIAAAPLSVAASRRIVAAAQGLPEEAVWEMTWAELSVLQTSQDAREGPLAFTEKRPPRWAGC